MLDAVVWRQGRGSGRCVCVREREMERERGCQMHKMQV